MDCSKCTDSWLCGKHYRQRNPWTQETLINYLLEKGVDGWKLTEIVDGEIDINDPKTIEILKMILVKRNINLLTPKNKEIIKALYKQI